MVSLILAFTLPVGLGFVLVSLIWPKHMRGRSDFVLKLALGTGLGVGVSSCLFFVWMVFLGASTGGFVLVEIGILLSLIVVAAVMARRPGEPSAVTRLGENERDAWFQWLNVSALLVLTGVTGAFLVLHSMHEGGLYGWWDARFIWNMRAHFITLQGDQWKQGFTNDMGWSHPDYPLLLPGMVARCWMFYLHSETPIVPIVIAGLFMFGTVALLASAVSTFRGQVQGLVVGVILLGTPFFVEHGASQDADVPLGFFCLATMVLLALHGTSSQPKGAFLTLAGIAGGMAAFTKNEGILFILVVVIAWSAVALFVKGRGALLREGVWFAAGLFPIMAVLVYFKVAIAPANDLVAGQGLRVTVERLLTLARYKTIFLRFLLEPFQTDRWFLMSALVPFYVLLMGAKVREEDRANTAICLLVLAGMLVGYFFVYVTTPVELKWHLNTSLPRVYLHVYPTTLFLAFFLIRSSELPPATAPRWDSG